MKKRFSIKNLDPARQEEFKSLNKELKEKNPVRELNEFESRVEEDLFFGWKQYYETGPGWRQKYDEVEEAYLKKINYYQEVRRMENEIDKYIAKRRRLGKLYRMGLS